MLCNSFYRFLKKIIVFCAICQVPQLGIQPSYTFTWFHIALHYFIISFPTPTQVFKGLETFRTAQEHTASQRASALNSLNSNSLFQLSSELMSFNISLYKI